jgi:hypothetical protein
VTGAYHGCMTNSTAPDVSTAVTTPPARPPSVRTTNANLIGRAIAAYYRQGNWSANTQPSGEVKVIKGLTYVVLRDAHPVSYPLSGTLVTVYRVLPGKDGKPGQLKHLRRPPVEIEGGA